jgi:single-strand DNA-binding protein|tara:strand:+ start:567 stop:965 length:399 start_codon:yes stop_codon:yes gene_type:complete
MYNQITLIGNLGADPDIKETVKGGKYALLSIATHKKMKGEKITEWHKVVVWDEKLAEVLESYTKKGSKVLLQGRLTYKNWEKDGVNVKQAEIHLDRFDSKIELLDSRGDSPDFAQPADKVAGVSSDFEGIPF